MILPPLTRGLLAVVEICNPSARLTAPFIPSVNTCAAIMCHSTAALLAFQDVVDEVVSFNAEAYAWGYSISLNSYSATAPSTIYASQFPTLPPTACRAESNSNRKLLAASAPAFTYPATFDWRNKSVLPRVKYQGGCGRRGSCVFCILCVS